MPSAFSAAAYNSCRGRLLRAATTHRVINSTALEYIYIERRTAAATALMSARGPSFATKINYSPALISFMHCLRQQLPPMCWARNFQRAAPLSSLNYSASHRLNAPETSLHAPCGTLCRRAHTHIYTPRIQKTDIKSCVAETLIFC